MSGKTYPPQVSITSRSFYGESPPKRSRLHETNSPRPAFKSLKDNSIKFDKPLEEPVKSLELKEPVEQPHDEPNGFDEPKNLDRDSPLPLKNLGNTCYENSIIQCLFNLDIFMDNFHVSMNSMRDMLEPKLKPLDLGTSSNRSIDDVNVDNDRESDNNSDRDVSSNNQITKHDVRYRIANAFDSLYTCYSQKRVQQQSSTKNQHEADIVVAQNLTSEPQSQLELRSNSAIDHKSALAIQSKSDTSDSTDTEVSLSQQQATTSSKPTQDQPQNIPSATTSNSDLTPIALVSSSTTGPSFEQSEIDTKLEDLKSAVGERSSQFNSTHQQDASEFFYHVVDSIQEFYQGMGKTSDHDNPVTKAFELELDYEVRCPKCRHKTMSDAEKIRTLPLALPHVSIDNQTTSCEQIEDYNPETNGAPTPPNSDLGFDSPKSSASMDEQKDCSDEKENQALDVGNLRANSSNNTMLIAKLELADKAEQSIPTDNRTPKTYTLDDALRNYFKDDLLDYKCSQPNCDSKQRTRKCLIRKLPQVLFITLARYSYTGKKNLDEVEAPFELHVPFRENKSPSHSPSAHDSRDEDDYKYRLVAVVCHLGPSLNAGHYTSYVYNQNNFSWYSCDDDSITKVQQSEVKTDASKSGYCFFYVRRSCLNIMPQQDDQNIRTTPSGDVSPIVVDTNVAESSVVLTPEASPKSSPTPPLSSQEDVELSESQHATCEGPTLDTLQDWS